MHDPDETIGTWVEYMNDIQNENIFAPNFME